MTLLSYRELASELGAAEGSVKRWAHEGMPVERAGAAVRVDPDRARDWLAKTRKRAPYLKAQQFVYFARNEAGLIKIGWTNDPARRKAELNRHDNVQLVAHVRGGKPLELFLHDHFAAFRVEGEWFRDEGDLAALVRCLEQKGDGS